MTNGQTPQSTTSPHSPTDSAPPHSPPERPPRRRRWPRRLVVSALVISLLANAWTWLESDPSPIGAWRSLEGRTEYLAAYDDVLAAMLAPSETHDVETTYGSVHVLRFGEADG